MFGTISAVTIGEILVAVGALLEAAQGIIDAVSEDK